MKRIIQNRKRGESLVYIIIWLVVFLMPVFMTHSEYGVNWQRVSFEWIRITPFLLIFLLHNLLFFKKFALTEKQVAYFSLTIFSILFISGASVFAGRFLSPPGQVMPIPRGDHFSAPNSLPAPISPWYVNLANNTLVSVLVVGFNAAIKLTVQWQQEEQKNRILEKEKLQAELAFLRNQVSPHFFMNTLNNIHALIDIDSESAKESVVKLSRLMRYLLYDSEQGKTTLEKEVEFIKSYVELMKLRLLPNVIISFTFPAKFPNVKIPSLLFISLVENAFKYGISYQEESFIKIDLKTESKTLEFRVENSLHHREANKESGGLGLKNLKKRLELLFGDDFTFTTNEKDKCFEAKIVIPAHGN